MRSTKERTPLIGTDALFVLGGTRYQELGNRTLVEVDEMAMNNQDPTTKNIKRMAGVSLAAGGLTLVVAGVFTLIGFLIDRGAGTGPRWMLILLIASMPLSLGGAYLVARRAIKRASAEAAAAQVEAGEEVEPVEEGEDPSEAK